MSRGAAVKVVLGEKSASVVCVKPSGDCFYECVQQAFFSAGLDVREFPGVNCEEGDDGMHALRRTAAEAVDKNIFDQFSMYHTAGLSDFRFMAKVKDEHMLKEKMLVSGRSAGCGTCLWANEFEIGAVCSALHLVVLIIDGQSSGNNRFVRMSPPEPQGQNHFVLLNRTRREHFNYITIQGRAVFSSDDLPLSVVSAWNLPLLRSGGAGGKRRSDENQGNDTNPTTSTTETVSTGSKRHRRNGI